MAYWQSRPELNLWKYSLEACPEIGLRAMLQPNLASVDKRIYGFALIAKSYVYVGERCHPRVSHHAQNCAFLYLRTRFDGNAAFAEVAVLGFPACAVVDYHAVATFCACDAGFVCIVL